MCENEKVIFVWMCENEEVISWIADFDRMELLMPI
jgi:hypothetical protein